MISTDPTIDPITGLPILSPSGPVQQIPLGQEVFPYADLNATAQPTRGPIYGDDIIPTSSLITAPDAQMKPRSIQSTTTRELRTREAVFQNLGAAIPDGTTAPVDVNVVSGGGGGGGTSKEKLQTQGVSDSGPESDGLLFAIATGPGELNTLFRVQVTIDIPAPASGTIEVGNCSIYLDPGLFGNTYVWHYIDDTIVSSTDKTFWVRDTVIFNPGWDLVNEVPEGSTIGFYGRKVGGCLYSCIIWYS